MDFTFVLKKVISGAIMPLSISLIIIFIGLLFLDKRNLKKAKVFITTGFISIIIISYQPFSHLILSPLEKNYPKVNDIPKDVKHILLLGGDVKNRGWEALRLYNHIDNAKIITSGYKAHKDIPEAISTAKLLQSVGIPKDDIIIHPQPKDTKEEAIKIKELLGQKPFFLVTSAYHMTRAMGIFQKEGLNPIASPTNYITQYTNINTIPKGKSLLESEIALHEYIGIVWAKIKGQI